MPCTGEPSFGCESESGVLASSSTPPLSFAANGSNDGVSASVLFIQKQTLVADAAEVAAEAASSLASSPANGGVVTSPGGVLSQSSSGSSEPICRYRTASSRSLVISNISFNTLHPLPGEDFENENWVDLCHCRLFLTQYRVIIVLHNQNSACAIPLLDVESVEAKDIVGLHIICKDGRIIRIQAGNSETAIVLYKKLTQVTCVTKNMDDLFTFKFHKSVSKNRSIPWIRRNAEGKHYSPLDALHREYKHLDLKEISWKITAINENFELCPTYPQYLIIPSSVSREELLNARPARFYSRFPTLVWRSKRTGALFYRASQPTVGFFGQSNENDVKLYEKMKTITTSEKQRKFLIMDARSYAAAWANRAKGGGFETSDAYADAEVVFMGLPNIHNLRYSFHQLRNLLNAPNDPNTYLQNLQSTMWLQYIGCLFAAVDRCLNALCFEGVSVLVHCSDGWDRTTQIVSLTMLIADPFYRTFDGFEILIQRQWVEFGHKFADRSSVLNGDENERSPVFLQFLDCVYQLWMKNPDAFEFNRRYLMKLVQHTYSGLFSTFLFNSVKEAIKAGCTLADKTSESHMISIEAIKNGHYNDDSNAASKTLKAFSIWDYLGKHNYEFHNPAYNAKHAHQKTMLVFPKLMSEFELWRDAYCCTVAQNHINNPDSVSQSSACVTTPSSTNVSLCNSVPHENVLEKTSTLSRSQSASSLTSLEPNTHSIQPIHISTHHNGTPLSSGTTPHPPVGSIGSTTSTISGCYVLPRMSSIGCGGISAADSGASPWQCQNFLDADGLSKVPIVFEDRVVEMLRDYLQLELQNKRISSDTSYYREIPRHHNLSNGSTDSQHGQTNMTVSGATASTSTPTHLSNHNYGSSNNHAITTTYNFLPSFHSFHGYGNANVATTTAATITATTRRVRNESIDSTSLGFEFIDDLEAYANGIGGVVGSVKRKHDSSSSTGSVAAAAPHLGNPLSMNGECAAVNCNGGCSNKSVIVRARMSSINSLSSCLENSSLNEGTLPDKNLQHEESHAATSYSVAGASHNTAFLGGKEVSTRHSQYHSSPSNGAGGSGQLVAG